MFADDFYYEQMQCIMEKYEPRENDDPELLGMRALKYEYTGETKTLDDGTVVKRIRCTTFLNDTGMVLLKDDYGVEPGDLGGWIENWRNLSHYGSCWVYDDAVVCGQAAVRDEAVVRNNAIVSGQSVVRGFADISGNARLSGRTLAWDKAVITDHAHVHDAIISDHARIVGQAEVCGGTKIGARVELGGDAYVTNNEQYLTIFPYANFDGALTFFCNKAGEIKVLERFGCYTLDDFLTYTKRTDPDMFPATRSLIKYIRHRMNTFSMN